MSFDNSEKKDDIRIQLGEYSERGDYHVNLDVRWPYLPVYLEKLRYVRQFLEKYGQQAKIVDLGCGEGVIVNEHHKKGFDIVGLDMDYKSEHILNGNLLETGFEDNSFDIVMLLDVLEHLSYADQEKALAEIHRILKPSGRFLFTVPNLAHFASRASFFLTGRLIRTSTIDRHIGDRPINEYIKLLKKHFVIEKRVGLFPTYPVISFLTYYIPAKVVFLHRIYNQLFAYRNWCFLNIIECKKK